MIEEPGVIGIANKIGNTCWFQSATQAIFRHTPFREAILNFDLSKILIKQDPDYLKFYKALTDHFKELMQCKQDINNKELALALRLDGKFVISEHETSGKDSIFGIIAFVELFSALTGDKRIGFHSLSTPFAGLVGIRPSTPNLMFPIDYILDPKCENVEEAAKKIIPTLFYLPDVLCLRLENKCEKYENPMASIILHEPYDYIISKEDSSKCSTHVKYNLFAVVIYQGSNADHATALIKIKNLNQWVLFDDANTTVKGGDECLNGTKLFNITWNWPAIFLYERENK